MIPRAKVPPQLADFPVPAQEAYARFQATGHIDEAQVVVLAILKDFAPRHAAEGSPFSDSLRLIEDLGFDSLAVAEAVFFIEDLFGVKITNQDLMRLATVGQLRAFVAARLARPESSP